MPSRRHPRSWAVHVAVVSTAALCGAALLAMSLTSPAAASIDPGSPPGVPVGGVPSQIEVVSLDEGSSVDGYLGPLGSESDPAVAYPPSHAGFPFTPMDFAGLVDATPPVGGPPTLALYCTDIRTDTSIGYGYDLGDWATAGTANAGYVARILNDYYPATALPIDGTPGISDDDDRAAAVQAAIWYFTDNFVVAGIDPLQAAVGDIVNAVRVQPPLPAPAAPTLSITPTLETGDVGSVTGPFTVSTSAPDATVSVAGAQLFADAAGTLPLSSPATVADGEQLWVRSTSAGDVTLTGTASLTVPTGSAYLYSGNIVGVSTAQNLVLADEVTLDATVDATARFQAPTTTTTSTTVAPTTVAPTTVPPTTVAPTIPPTTAAPTSVAPTTPTTRPRDSVAAADARRTSDGRRTSTRPRALASTGGDRALLIVPGLLLVAGGAVLIGLRRPGQLTATVRGTRTGRRSGPRP